MDKSFPKFLESVDGMDPDLKGQISALYESLFGYGKPMVSAVASDVNPQQMIPEIGRCVDPAEGNPYFDDKTAVQGKRGEIAKAAQRNRGGAANFPAPGRTSLGMSGNARSN